MSEHDEQLSEADLQETNEKMADEEEITSTGELHEEALIGEEKLIISSDNSINEEEEENTINYLIPKIEKHSPDLSDESIEAVFISHQDLDEATTPPEPPFSEEINTELLIHLDESINIPIHSNLKDRIDKPPVMTHTIGSISPFECVIGPPPPDPKELHSILLRTKQEKLTKERNSMNLDITFNDKVNELLVEDHLIVFDSPAEEKSSDTDEEEPFQVIETNAGLKVVSPKKEFGINPLSPSRLKNEKTAYDWTNAVPHLSPASPSSIQKEEEITDLTNDFNFESSQKDDKDSPSSPKEEILASDKSHEETSFPKIKKPPINEQYIVIPDSCKKNEIRVNISPKIENCSEKGRGQFDEAFRESIKKSPDKPKSVEFIESNEGHKKPISPIFSPTNEKVHDGSISDKEDFVEATTEHIKPISPSFSTDYVVQAKEEVQRGSIRDKVEVVEATTEHVKPISPSFSAGYGVQEKEEVQRGSISDKEDFVEATTEHKKPISPSFSSAYAVQAKEEVQRNSTSDKLENVEATTEQKKPISPSFSTSYGAQTKQETRRSSTSDKEEKDEQSDTKCSDLFGVKSYLHQFYEKPSFKDPDVYDDDDLRYLLNPNRKRPCCHSIWWKIFVWIGLNFLLFGVIGVLVGYLVPPKQALVESSENNIEVLDTQALQFNANLDICKLVGLILFCIGGTTLTIALLFPSFLHQYCIEEKHESIYKSSTCESHPIKSSMDDIIPTTTSISSVQPSRIATESVYTKEGLLPVSE